MKTVFLQPTEREDLRGISSNGRRVLCGRKVSWKVVDEAGVDLIQPWFDYKGDARWFAETLGWTVSKEAPK